jgi:hypothetical protein
MRSGSLQRIVLLKDFRPLEGSSGAWIYGLADGMKRIVIEEGVSQGCTLGSFLYSLGTFPLVKAIQNVLGGEESGNFTKFFVEDGNFCDYFETMTLAIEVRLLHEEE